MGESSGLASGLHSAFHYCRKNAFNFKFFVELMGGLNCVVKQRDLLEADDR